MPCVLDVLNVYAHLTTVNRLIRRMLESCLLAQIHNIFFLWSSEFKIPIFSSNKVLYKQKCIYMVSVWFACVCVGVSLFAGNRNTCLQKNNKSDLHKYLGRPEK